MVQHLLCTVGYITPHGCVQHRLLYGCLHFSTVDGYKKKAVHECLYPGTYDVFVSPSDKECELCRFIVDAARCKVASGAMVHLCRKTD